MQPHHAHPHYHVTATADDGTCAEHIEGAYLPALATARRLVSEAQQPGGAVAFDLMQGELPLCAGLWLLYDATAAAVTSVAVSGACYGHHMRSAVQEVPALRAA